ncbi:hypothetical protein [Candidatus Palauibacter sp.]|uniref:hypothetical protein n=1 Tax=Candidatus Palauibacter sp. TaxID=3101350 RepID=UPI003B01A133
MRTIVRQDASGATAWLGRIRNLRHDPVADHLLGVDIDDHRIVEFTTGGGFVGYFGRYGEGPGEMRNLAGFEVTGRHVISLDRGNAKLVVFDRFTRQAVTEVPLNRGAMDLTLLGDTLVAVMPGPDGTLYELFEVDGRSVGAFGDGAFLASCVRCSITSIGEELLAVVKPGSPEGRIYRLDGTMFDAFGFGEVVHVLTEWREDFLATVRGASRMVAPGGGGMPAGRLWAGSTTGAIGDGSFFVRATPENMDVNPGEMWVLDRRGRVQKRYVFDPPLIGVSTVSFPRIFAVGLSREFGVYEYRLPADYDGP